MATEDIQTELLNAVKALKGQVIHRDSLSVGIDWSKPQKATAPKTDVSRVKSAGKNKEQMLQIIRQEMGDCQLCPLGKTRKNLVFGVGNPEARIVFVGEAPGADEDEQGLPFVGRAGQLLTDIIVKGMKMQRKDVYICNILKCRPPGNRNPQPDEISRCEPFLKKQLQLIAPEIICALGTFAAKTLLKTEIPISALRGRFHLYEGIKLMPTYHPAYLLRNPSAKKQVWEDIQMIMKEANL
ncbi:MAG TPA: uracil-DNA glycosylase [Smithella sp.]|nr:uracil-DNA glycosylase [Smithella sp.]HNY49001.1 uracil-DNA glycosylase [Smithella sp.]HOG89085.1 uracil-DNA glycosylase [Smithella sp.]HOU50997.1 uracil-DNA glycosylase [Smithella sp.]HQG64204.1 uracil-DNA glycosylase [Smithella sp.]